MSVAAIGLWKFLMVEKRSRNPNMRLIFPFCCTHRFQGLACCSERANTLYRKALDTDPHAFLSWNVLAFCAEEQEKKKRMSDRKREKSFYSPTCFNDGLLFSFSRKNEQELWMRFCNFFFCHLENLFSRWLFSSAFCMCMLTNFHPRSSYRQNRRKIKYHVLEIGRNRIQLARFS